MVIGDWTLATEGLTPVLTVGDCSSLKELLAKKFQPYLAGRTFEITSGVDDDAIIVAVILRNRRGTFFYPIEARVERHQFLRSGREGALCLCETIDTYLDEFFHNQEEIYLPIDWTPYPCEKVEVQLRGQIFNLEVEEMADALLNAAAAKEP